MTQDVVVRVTVVDNAGDGVRSGSNVRINNTCPLGSWVNLSEAVECHLDNVLRPHGKLILAPGREVTISLKVSAMGGE